MIPLEIIEVEGIIIAEKPYGETSKILNIITKDKEIISGASTYSYYENGVELELATHENYRKMGFASITASSFILECMRRRLIPHWDARNLTSLKIAEKIGFTLRDKYPAFEFEQSCFGK